MNMWEGLEKLAGLLDPNEVLIEDDGHGTPVLEYQGWSVTYHPDGGEYVCSRGGNLFLRFLTGRVAKSAVEMAGILGVNLQ